MNETTVGEWMHPGVIACGPETPIAEVAATMERNDISALVVVDSAGEAQGVISQTDLVNARFVQPYMKHWRGLTAEHLMTRPVISVTAETTIIEAVRLLNEKHIHRVVVVEKISGPVRPIGILSITDLARHAEDHARTEE